MLHSAAALLVRSFRVDSRLPQWHAIRLVFVLGICGELWWVRAWSSITGAGAPGLTFFKLNCGLTFLLITLAGTSWFATAITEEKEEFTLGLLKMAGMSPVALLLGKSTSRLLAAVSILCVQFPFALFAITLGGVTPGQILAAYVSLCAYLILVANAGLLCSVCSATSRQASIRMIVILAAFFSGPLIARRLFYSFVNAGFLSNAGWVSDRVHDLIDLVEQLSVVDRGLSIFQTGFAGRPFNSLQVWSNLILAAACFTAAWAGFERFTREVEKPLEPRGESLDRKLRSHRPVRFRGRVWRNSLRWKDFQFIAGGGRVVLIKSIVIGIIIGGNLVYTILEEGPFFYFSRNPAIALGMLGARIRSWILLF